MPTRLILTDQLSTDEFARGYRTYRDPAERSYWQTVRLPNKNHTCPAEARTMGYRADIVRDIVHRYNAAGIADRRHTNRSRPPLVTPAVPLGDRRPRAAQTAF